MEPLQLLPRHLQQDSSKKHLHSESTESTASSHFLCTNHSLSEINSWRKSFPSWSTEPGDAEFSIFAVEAAFAHRRSEGRTNGTPGWICFFYLSFCILLLSLQVKNVAYSLKYTGEPMLKALTLEGVALFHSYGEKSCKTEINICLVGGSQEHGDLTSADSSKNKGFFLFVWFWFFGYVQGLWEFLG